MHIARKRFGQHFLHDKDVIQRLLSVIGPQIGDHIVEIGPGQGALTVPILKEVHACEAIELDRDLIPALQLRCREKGTLTIHAADALTFDFFTLVRQDQPLRIVGNLPYNISTPLIFHLLKYAAYIQDMHFMLQKEVVQRIAATQGTSEYGRLSVMVQYHCQVTALFEIPPSAFYPPPTIDSQIIRLVPYQGIVPLKAENYEHFARIVKEAFSHRRKTLRNSLKGLITDQDWAMLPIDSHLRPEDIGVNDYVTISNHMMNPT